MTSENRVRRVAIRSTLFGFALGLALVIAGLLGTAAKLNSLEGDGKVHTGPASFPIFSATSDGSIRSATPGAGALVLFLATPVACGIAGFVWARRTDDRREVAQVDGG
jgi:hypothetical protein